MVSMPNYAPSTMGVVRRIVEEEGFFRGLYQGVGFLLARQVLFGMVKFLVFDGLTSWMLSLCAVLAEAQLLVSDFLFYFASKRNVAVSSVPVRRDH